MTWSQLSSPNPCPAQKKLKLPLIPAQALWQPDTGLLDIAESSVCHSNTGYVEFERRSGEHSLMDMPCGPVKDPSLSRSRAIQRVLRQFTSAEKSRSSACVGKEEKDFWSRNVRTRKQHKYLMFDICLYNWQVLNYYPEVQNEITGLDGVNFSTPHTNSPTCGITREERQ